MFLQIVFLPGNASRPYIRFRECEKYINVTGKRQCAYEVARDRVDFSLSCSVYGARPKPSVYWVSPRGRKVRKAHESYTEWPDGTFDVTVTTSWRSDRVIGTTEVFYCIAEGLSVNGVTKSAIIVYYVSGN